MTKVRLGKTEIITNKNGFGALPIQRIPYEEAEALIYEAYDNGMTFYDTARFYTDSEEKLGRAIAKRGIRDKVYIASKTMCNTTEEFWSQLAQSLSDLQTDYLDLYQFHNPAFCPK
ncbi:MAG: aldo/keto reductase, partial [Emergencia timonensis]